ncbi:hypothetical protein [Natrinema soli]|uniref:Type I restriction enzyme R protein N-terminal domain-containing protein n=1 Tax=Natrinema soli TaxID=1930624 RepID=A0ABD5SSV5_9EURY|nr:hypothetical protein [Natrinema soli]
MPSLDLDAFVARTAAVVDSSPPTTLRETRTWLVEPFLETLGWAVRAESCVTDRIVDDVRLEYVPTVDTVPGLFVAAESATDSLEESRANALRRAMAWTGVDRAIYTNGRQYLLLAGTTDVEYHALERAELPAHESVIADYSRAAVGQRLGRDTRTHVARRLAVEHPILVESIADRLADATGQGDRYAAEFEAATDRFLDRLVVAFTEDGGAPPDDAADVSIRFSESTISEDESPSERAVDADSSADTDLESETDSPDATGSADRPKATARDGDSARPTADTETDDDKKREREGDEDGEYVVRFFNDRSSIGAIGHSTAAGALVEAADYLLERGLSGVEVPWSPDEGERTVLNADPTRADDSPMDAPERLSNGLVLETAGDVDERATRVEALAARAGLRVMLTGDWD